MEAPRTAMGSTAMRPGSVVARCQATPTSRRASVKRSATDLARSLRDLVDVALAPEEKKQ